MSAIKTTTDSIYAYRFIRLIQKDFDQWKAFELGIIDNKGHLIRRPKTEEEKSSYTPFHAAVRSVKRMVSKVPGATTAAVVSSSLSAIGSRFGLTESELDMIKESMVAGDAGGNPENIASGTTSGDITLTGPETIGPKDAKKDKKIISFKDI